VSFRKIVLCLISFLFLGFGLWQGWNWRHFAQTPFNNARSTTIVVPPHSTLWDLSHQLEQRGFLNRTQMFIILARQMGCAGKLHVGEYAIQSKTTPASLIHDIITGKVVKRKLTFVEGLTMRQIRELLANNDALQHISVQQTDAELMASLGHPGESTEGRFFPDTYIYTWGNKDTLILHQAYQRMSELLAKEWQQRDPNLPYKTPDEALIVASLVESEAELTSERPVIAGVIMRRLQHNMNLQVDPTVTYGAGKPFGSTITLEDLRNDNPYNTYLHKGLPPTPINMPSAASLTATLHPAPGDSLYYVSQGDGSHKFSSTYSEHLEAVKKYRQLKQSEANKQKWLGLGLFIVRSAELI
jgi:UPF0755 protein